MAFAALTVGMLEMIRGHDAIAHGLLSEVDDLGDQFGNNWLMSTARTQLATLAVRAGDFDDARALLLEARRHDGSQHPQHARRDLRARDLHRARAGGGRTRGAAAIAVGAASGMRSRAGLLTWPLTRQLEADLVSQVKISLEPESFEDAFDAGAELHLREALTLYARASHRR